jgi:hypothetical protein
MSRRNLLSQDWNGIEPIDGDCGWLEESLKKVFPVYDPFRPEVADGLLVRTLLFPTDMYHLDEFQFRALRTAIEATQEQNFYISEIEWQPDTFQRGSHWLCSEPTFEQYIKLPIGVENALYSPDGRWGILLSHELHGFMACDRAFFDAFTQNYPQVKDDIEQFREYWRDREQQGMTVDWLDQLYRTLSDSGTSCLNHSRNH